jgi:glycerophosphoryl diester phosphodiesterase
LQCSRSVTGPWKDDAVPRLPALRQPPIAFAHRGGRAHHPDNTLVAFRAALAHGATGLESDVWLTADGVPVLDHDGVVGSFLRRRRIANLERRQLPDHIPVLADLYAECGTDFDLSLDIKDPDAARAVLDVARAAGDTVVHRLWLCHPDWERVATWRALDPHVRLVDSTRVRRIREGTERRAAELRSHGIDALNLPESEWTGGLASLFHRFDRYCFGWDAQHDRQLDRLLDLGIDGVFSDHVDRMVAAMGRHYGSPDV